MAYFAKQRLIYYRKFKIDIWGFMKNTRQVQRDFTYYYIFYLSKKKKKIEKNIFTKIFEFKRVSEKLTYLKNLYKEKKIDKKELLQHYKVYKRKKKIKILNICRIWMYHMLYFIIFKSKISRRLVKIFKTIVRRKPLVKKRYFRNFFIYDPRYGFQKYKKFKANFEFVSVRVIKLFYIIYNYKQLKKIIRKSNLKNGMFDQNFFYFIECKLPSYIYRTSLFSTLFDSIKMVKGGNVWINKKYKPLLYYNVNLFDIVGYRPLYKSFIFWNYFRRLRRKAILFMNPRCIYLSYIFFFTILLKRFKKKDIINTFSVDYFRCLSFKE